MSTTRSVLVLLLALVLLAGCAVRPTPIPTRAATPTAGAYATQAPTVGATVSMGIDPTFGQRPTNTPTPSPTPTPTPLPILPDWFLPYVGIGFGVNSLNSVLGEDIPAESRLGFPTYRLSGGGTVHFEYSDRVVDMPIVSRIEVEGRPAIVPSHDAVPVNDFRIDLGGGLSVEPLDAVTIARMTGVLGVPVNDATLRYDSPIDGSRSYFRTLDFIGLEVTLSQAVDAPDKSKWVVESIVFSSADYETPRGLKVGMTLPEIQKRFGTDEFCMYLDGSRDGLHWLSLSKNQTYMDWGGPYLSVEFLDDKVVDWRIDNAEPT
jgi:hypothetical protein